MKKLIAIISTACMIAGSTAAYGFEKVPCINQSTLTKGCKAAYLIDSGSGECIYKENETQRMPIASVCKVMTLTVCLDAISSGKLSYDDMITASEHAAGMGGSQVFLGAGCQYSVDQLLKSIVVCSANDSCVAMSEAVAGSEEGFVAQLNK